MIQYRAILGAGRDPGGQRGPHRQPGLPAALVDSVTIAGWLQSEIGCPADWDPACAASSSDLRATDGLWQGDLHPPGGDYEYKVAINDCWDCELWRGRASKAPTSR